MVTYIGGWPLRNASIEKLGSKFRCTPRYMRTMTLCMHRYFGLRYSGWFEFFVFLMVIQDCIKCYVCIPWYWLSPSRTLFCERIHWFSISKCRGRGQGHNYLNCPYKKHLLLGDLNTSKSCQNSSQTPSPLASDSQKQICRLISFFLSWISKTQPNHWTKRMENTRLAT